MDVHLTTLYTVVCLTAYQVWRLSHSVQNLHERLLELEKVNDGDDEDELFSDD